MEKRRLRQNNVTMDGDDAAANAIERQKKHSRSRLRCMKTIELRKMETHLLVEAVEVVAEMDNEWN